jgi:hypothetical protein
MNRCIALTLCLFALIAPLSGCAGSGTIKTTPGKGPGFEIPGVRVQWDIPAGYCLKGQFLDADGNPMGPEVGGGSSGSMAIPRGAKWVKYKVVKCEDSQEAVPSGPYGPIQPQPVEWFDVGRVGCDDTHSPLIHYGLSARAKTDVAAEAKAEVIMLGGPGTAVPFDVQVNSFVELTPGATVATLETSLPNSFKTATVTVNGTVVADLATGLNCTVLSQGNNWETVQITLPTSLVPAGSIVVLNQSGSAGSHQDLKVEMTL